MSLWPSLSFCKWENWNPERLNVFLPHPFMLALNEFIDRLRADSMQVDDDHKGSLLLQPLCSALYLVPLAHLLSLLPHVRVSHRSDLRTWHLAVYSVPLLTSPELFTLAHHKLWNCRVKNYLAVWVWFLCVLLLLSPIQCPVSFCILRYLIMHVC